MLCVKVILHPEVERAALVVAIECFLALESSVSLGLGVKHAELHLEGFNQLFHVSELGFHLPLGLNFGRGLGLPVRG